MKDVKIIATRPRAARLLVATTTTVVTTAAALALTGCSGGSVDPVKPTNSPTASPTASPTSPAGGDLSAACATVTPASAASGGLPVCTALHPDGIALRLPTAPSADQGYGGFTRAGTGFVTADGTTHEVAEDVRTKVAKAADDAGYVDYGTTAYLATLEGGTVTSVAPALRIDRNSLVKAVFGGTTMVGKITPVDTPVDAEGPTYSGAPSLPVVITWSDQASDGTLSGTIANATKGAAVGGTCAPALSASPGDPLVGGFTASVGLFPYPSMHEGWDDELVLSWDESSSGMGSAFYPSVATLMGKDPIQGTWEVVQHGTPVAGPMLDLTLQPKGTAVTPC